jgi:ABC-type dipeptide/oligopeptide/nickel transport system ATPase component
MNQLLSIRGLRTYFYTESGVAKAVDGVDLDIAEGEVLGLVGESGSGKSVTALSILRLIPDPPGRIVAGEVLFTGRDLLKLSWDQIREIRGNDISMVFQEPMTSLNPVFTIGMQVMEVILAHEDVSKEEAHRRAVEILTEVGIPDAEQRMKQYPHHFSGGQRDSARAQPLAAHRRRADDGARRDDPGADSRPDARDEGASQGRLDPPHHTQPRRCCGDL